MRYKELKISAGRTISEELQAALIDAGFVSMQIDDSAVAAEILDDPGLYKYDYLNEEIEDLAKGTSEEIGITLYFADDEEGRAQLKVAEALIDAFRAGHGEAGISWRIEEAGDDSEWLYKWQEYFKPVKVGERIVVKPSWEEYEPEPDDLVIEMDPGMAFGSGLHETTSMCIKALEKALAGGPVQCGRRGNDAFGRRAVKVLDVGTGTGILAIAAAMLGAEDCLGIDIDDEAVRVAGENISKNGLAGAIEIRKGDLVEGVDYEADIVVANLMADLVMKLSPAAASHLRPGGLFISSGILDMKEETVARAVEEAGFDIIEILADGEWRAIVAVRNAR